MCILTNKNFSMLAQVIIIRICVVYSIVMKSNNDTETKSVCCHKHLSLSLIMSKYISHWEKHAGNSDHISKYIPSAC